MTTAAARRDRAAIARRVAAAAGVCALTLVADPARVRAQGGDAWAPQGPPARGFINALAIDALSPATVYAVTEGHATVSKSIDGGNTWTDLAPLPRGTIDLIAVDPQTPTTIYAGWTYSWEGAVYKSTDGGATWAQGTGLPSTLNPNALIINPQIPATVFMGATADPARYGGVYKSTDGGATWTAAKAGLPDPGVISLAVDPQDTNVLYAGTWHGVFKTIDGGTNWTQTGLSVGYVDSLAIEPGTPTTLYAATRDGHTSLVYKSTDGGSVWMPIQNGLPNPVTVVSLVVDPRRPATLYAGTVQSGVFRSTDAGASWTPMNNGLTTVRVKVLAIDDQVPATLYAGTWGGGVFAVTPRE